MLHRVNSTGRPVWSLEGAVLQWSRVSFKAVSSPLHEVCKQDGQLTVSGAKEGIYRLTKRMD